MFSTVWEHLRNVTYKSKQYQETYARSCASSALRLMLPEPRGTFATVGQKICDELVHFDFALSERGRPYKLTAKGREVLGLLTDRRYVELRQVMASVHLKTYDNLRAVVRAHVEGGPIWQPVVSAVYVDQPGYLGELLEPTFQRDAAVAVEQVLDRNATAAPKQIEDILRSKVLKHSLPHQNMRVALFRAICDRLVSLRLLNKPRVSRRRCEFEKTYSPCVSENPSNRWHKPLQVPLDHDRTYQIFLSEPDATDPEYQTILLSGIEMAMSNMDTSGGYYDIPQLRDRVCENLLIPEAAFDDGLNYILDLQPAVLSVGLQYDKITGRRLPLVRSRDNTQLHNLIRKV